MFGKRRELLDRLDRLASEVQEQTRALAAIRAENEQLHHITAKSLAEVQESLAANTLALQGEIAAAVSPLASSHDVDVARTSLAGLADRLAALEAFAAKSERYLDERSAEITSFWEEFREVEGRNRAATDELRSAIQKSAERTASAFTQVDSRLRVVPERSEIEAISARLEGIERRIGAVHDRISKLVEENVQALAKPASEIQGMRSQLSSTIAELKDWRQRLGSEARQNLVDLRTATAKTAEENANLKRTVDLAAAEVRMASQEMATKLSAAIDRHLEAEVVPRIESMLEDLGKLLKRLEVRGASTFKTAKAKILENLLKKDVIGGKHTPWENALNTLNGPEREVGDAALKDLVRLGLVVEKPTGAGPHVFLDPKRVPEVERAINGEGL